VTLFSTGPKTRRHVDEYIMGNRLRDFMEQCHRKHLHRCSYEVLRFEFINHRRSGDPRTIEHYIGRPAQTKEYPSARMLRRNEQTGETQQFVFQHTRRLEQKKGLAQELGWITFENGNCVLHHELFSYSSEQTTLKTPNSTLEYQGKERIKDDLCVSRIERFSQVERGRRKPI
jgi:hypothetical protein